MVQAAAGLFWVAVLFAAVLAVQRSFALEATDGARDGLRLSGLDPAGIFLGKAAAVAVQLVVLEVLLTAGVVLLYGAHVRSYGAARRRLRGRHGRAWPRRAPSTARWPPGCACARRSCRSSSCPWWPRCCWPARGRGRRPSGRARRRTRADPWLRLLLVFAVVYLALGRRHLRAPAGGGMTGATRSPSSPRGAWTRAQSSGSSPRCVGGAPRSGWDCG